MMTRAAGGGKKKTVKTDLVKSVLEDMDAAEIPGILGLPTKVSVQKEKPKTKKRKVGEGKEESTSEDKGEKREKEDKKRPRKCKVHINPSTTIRMDQFKIYVAHLPDDLVIPNISFVEL
jgi:hypothetical protein